MNDIAFTLNLAPDNFPLERYEPRSLLGRGGLGEVYLCKDSTLGRMVAVKRLIAVDDEMIVIFHREAKIASRLHHPNIVGTLDFGTTNGGRPFIAFEYFEGISLEHLILERGGVLDEDLVRRIFIIVANALSYIHEHNVFHRDLKPSNILLTIGDTGEIDLRIIDFGVSAIKEDIQNRTLVQGKTIVGTPVYMSPDPVRGDTFDARSEVYSLGCIMYECLTGIPPFDAPSTAEVLDMHMSNEAPLLEEANPDRVYSPEIQAIVRQCLNKDKDMRFQTMTDLVQALEQPTAKPLPAEGIPADAPSKKKLSAVQLAIAAGIMILLVAGAATTMMSILHGPEQKDNILNQKKDLEELTDSSKVGLHVKTNSTIKLEHEDDGSKGIYLSGAESSRRLQALADAGIHKQLVAFNNLTITSADAKNLNLIGTRQLRVSNCEVPLDTFKVLATSQSLYDIDFHRTPDLTPEKVELLKLIPHLTDLVLVGCSINDKHLKALGRIPNLHKLVLDGNKDVTMQGLLHIAKKDHPTMVWINEGPLTKLSTQEILELRQKKNIYLSNKLEIYEGDGGDGLINPDALELIE